jgi:RNA-directed DNA polymerase
MGVTKLPMRTETKLKRIAWLSRSDPDKQFNCLIHHYNEESLKQCFNELDGKKAVGHDGIDKVKYAENLGENIQDLLSRMKRMAYKPGATRQVMIPKEGKPNALRPLCIANFEDKIIQKMTHKILESIYEPLFLKCSYGFREGRGCHDAIRELRQYLYKYEVQKVIDIDLANFFGTIDHKLLLEILQEKIKDKRMLRYIVRMFKAGVLANGELSIDEEGVPQGSLSSPILANVFAHRVIDQWFEEIVKKYCKGRVELFRYCDDGIICCQYEEDGCRIKEALAKRLEKYKLKLNEEKTKLVSFSKKAYSRGRKQQAFDFLGFTFYLGKSRKGAITPKVKTSGKRIRSKLKRVNDWCRKVRSKYRLKQIYEMFTRKLKGHIGYYGVSFNLGGVWAFVNKAVKILYKWLNRRSQKKSFDWDKFNLFLQRYPLPKIKVVHALY